MPPRRSNVSTAAAVVEEDIPAEKSAPREPKDDTLGVEDLNLPRSIVQRLAKGVLPANTQIQKDALLAMSKSATVFVNYLTSCAAEQALRSGKKTVMPKDVFEAMHELEFPFMLNRLEAEVAKFTATQADKRNTYRKKVREERKAAKDGHSLGETSMLSTADGEGDSPRAAKRARMEDGEGASDVEDGDADEGQEEEGDEEVEDDEVEEEEDETQGEGLVEDPLEEKEDNDEDDEMADGDESD